MSKRVSSHILTGGTVEKYIGTEYDKVKEVHDSLSKLIEVYDDIVNGNIQKIVDNIDSGIIGENNTSSNSGTGEGFALTKVGANLPFKSLKVTGGISISSDGDSITLDGSTVVEDSLIMAIALG